MPSTEEILLQDNFDLPILEYYHGHFESCYVILHPFYKQIFDDDYDEFANYKLTNPLIEKISWEEIMRATGIKSLSKLALTITYPACSREYQELVKHEWNEFEPFLEENKINCCYWAEDEIPKDILYRFSIFFLI